MSRIQRMQMNTKYRKPMNVEQKQYLKQTSKVNLMKTTGTHTASVRSFDAFLCDCATSLNTQATRCEHFMWNPIQFDAVVNKAV